MGTTNRPRTLIFDVLGTLLDEDAGLLAAATELAGPEHAAAFASSWQQAHAAALTNVRDGARPYVSYEALHAEAVGAAAAETGLPVTTAQGQAASRFGHHLEPFDDVVAGLDELARDHRLVGLTNAGTAQAFAMSGHAGLRWTTLVSSETVGAFKPDPRMYAHARTSLALDPGSCLFVAAHPWDLDAAAAHGFRTAYVDRSASTSTEMDAYGRRFDHAVAGVGGLAAALAADLPTT
ncbi:haloacid dehalogenase type II [Aeromicrobium chenweiae]|uniref:haloacid dehalogenase type II n=1 Tax=Aeromicrobium chenweiae TaxID=2079793 RepID=UPI00131F141B|nr:haloacid dehalogenase type II [Aeromicrobium chenweiae]